MSLKNLPKEVLTQISSHLLGLNEIKDVGSINKNLRAWFMETYGSIITDRKNAVNIALNLHTKPIINDMMFMTSFIRKSMSFRVMSLIRAIYFLTPDQPHAPIDHFIQSMRHTLRQYVQRLETELREIAEERDMHVSNCIRCLTKNHDLFQTLRPIVWQIIQYGKEKYGPSYEYRMERTFDSFKIKKIDLNDDLRMLKFIMLNLSEFRNFQGDHRMINEVNTSWMYWVEIRTIALVYEPLLSEFFEQYEQVLKILHDSEQHLAILSPNSIAYFVRFSWVFKHNPKTQYALDNNDPFEMFFDDDKDFVSYEV
jgi:hypothetical protein